MSWIIQSHLNNRYRIKFGSFGNQKELRNISITEENMKDIGDFFSENTGARDAQINSDEFNDILLIEKAIKEMYTNGTLSKQDLQILSNIETSEPNRNRRA